MIILTSDTDWVPDEILNYFLDIVDEYKAKITIFATHKLDGRDHEIGLHPNLETTYDKVKYQRYTSLQETVKLKKVFNSAIGTRSHGLNVCTDMLLYLPILGIRYDSSYLMSFQDNIHPYTIYPGVTEMPIHWMDIEILRFGKSLKFNNEILKEQQKSNSIYVYDFHPSHVFTNTSSLDFYYNIYKPHYSDVGFLEGLRDKKNFGTEDALIQLLEAIDSSKLTTMSEVCMDFEKNSKH
ncbi:MAG: hypothetical protein KGI11_08175 [Thaumarchaeota archaeon]|nr:hypothetical protein [Nitrososphaerota archaeon]